MHKKLTLLSFEHPAESVVIRVLSLVLAVLLCLYLYFVAASVLNIIARKQADASATAVQSSINDLEQQYFSLSQTMTAQKATQLGLTPVGSISYVYQPGNAAAASISSDSVTI